MGYEGSIELISGIKSKNNGTFPLVDADKVYVRDNESSSKKYDSLADILDGITGNGIVTLDENGKVHSSQLPSYVDDVLEYDNQSSFPSTGETGKIYVAKDTNKTYRWSGSAYIAISSDIALGETSSTAYRGDRGKIAYDHASAKGSAFSSGLYKITTNSQGHVTAATAAGNTDIAPLVIDDNATDTSATTKTWSAQKSINELAKKVNETDLFAGCTEYVPAHRASFHTNTWYHEQGTAYICRLKSDDPDLVLVLTGSTNYVPGGGMTELPYHLPTVENSTFYVYSIVDYIDSKATTVNSELDILAIYTGVAEYTPAAEVTFAPGIFYRQIGAKYIGMLKGNSNLAINLNSGTYQIPSESDNDWDIMYFGDPRLKEAMIFPLEGIAEYTPVAEASFGTSNAYHEVGSKYICVTKDNTLTQYNAAGYPMGSGGFFAEVSDGVYHLPTASNSDVDVYTIGQFLHAWRTKRVSISSPVLSDDLSIVGANLSREQLLTLLGLVNDSNGYVTPPTTIKLGSTTLTEAQLQELLSLVSATGVGF